MNSGRMRLRRPAAHATRDADGADRTACAVRVRDLRVARGGREVLHGLSFDIFRGSVTGLIGPSGGGKTTLMRAIMGVQVVSGGTVQVLGHRAGSPALRRSVAYSTQEASVYADLTVTENLRYFATLLAAPRSDIDLVISELKLASERNQVVSSLSGGQLHRASLAVALLGQPELLVLDEPTVGLDPELRDELWVLFRRLSGRGLTLVVSSHVMNEASRCDRLLLIREGKTLADDTPHGLTAASGTSDLDEAFLRLIRSRKEVPA
jgi:ABC-2 type transport system ATP-binding protein